MKNYHKVILLAVLLAAGCRGTSTSDLRLTGTLELTEHSIGPRVAGRVTEISAEESQEVKKGQRLVLMDRYDQAKRDYNRALRLFQQGGGTEQAVEQARLALEDQEILSPIDGIVLVKVREVGEMVPSGGPILVLGESAHPWVGVYVPEGQINRFQVGQPATLRFDGLSRDYKGHVSFIATRAEYTPRNVQTPEERVTQTFEIKVTLDESDPNLHPGVAADVVLPQSR